MTRTLNVIVLLYLLLGLFTYTNGQSQSVKLSYIKLADGGSGILYEPVSHGVNASIGLINIHPQSDYLGHSSCMNMAERGYRILCGNTRFTNLDEAYQGFEDHAPAVSSAVAYLRQLPGLDNVVLIGHSMSAPMMAFYQNIAENGAGACQGPEKIMPCDDTNLKDLSVADGLVLLDPHYGPAVGTLTYIDPAITDEARPGMRDQDLDMFAEKNGYSENGATYSAEFKKKFLLAQAARHKRLTNEALEQWDAIKKDNGMTLYTDDMPFTVHGVQSRFWQPDTSLLKQGTKPALLLKADGSTSTQVLTSVRPPSGSKGRALSSDSSLLISVRRWLATHAIRTTPEYGQTKNALTGIEWSSSTTSTPSNLRTVTVPLLVMVMTGHYFIHNGELLMENSGSSDKGLVGVEGATHGFTPCVRCEETPSQYGDTVKLTYDYIDNWLSERF